MGCGLRFRWRKGSQPSRTTFVGQRVNGGRDARSVFSRSCARQTSVGRALLALRFVMPRCASSNRIPRPPEGIGVAVTEGAAQLAGQVGTHTLLTLLCTDLV